jgi:DNA mismatch repair ATPase MutS
MLAEEGRTALRGAEHSLDQATQLITTALQQINDAHSLVSMVASGTVNPTGLFDIAQMSEYLTDALAARNRASEGIRIMARAL